MLIIVGVAGGMYGFGRSDYWTRVGEPQAQPVPFSHQHHVAGLGIDCRYCHTSVEKSAFAGMPPTDTCMTCHSQVWKDAPVSMNSRILPNSATVCIANFPRSRRSGRTARTAGIFLN
ncbi:MAG: cytochrome c3 family protein [Verrucomicrobiota bacterium]